MSNKLEQLLDSIPDFIHWENASYWITHSQKFVHASSKTILEDEILFLEWEEISSDPDQFFGLYASENWRKFVLAVFLADLVSYSNKNDQVNFERLLFILHAFPKGFRIWWNKLSDGLWYPIGYTGWYPMSEVSYELFKKHPDRLIDRTVVPVQSTKKNHSLLYLFNYSVAPKYKKSILTSLLLKKFFEEIILQKPEGLACITVSEDGSRIARNLGMSCTGQFSTQGVLENVYVK